MENLVVKIFNRLLQNVISVVIEPLRRIGVVKCKKLFDGDEDLFKRMLINNTKVYAEYGCGDSTIWVSDKTDVEIYSVDTSQRWVERVREAGERLNENIKFVDCGDIGQWGRPVDYGKRDNFIDYTDYIWKQKVKPDTILIDGRFRVCCFFTCLKYADPGAQIIFDDYTFRPHYHVVEEFLSKKEENGRQCLFVVPDKSELDLNKIDREIEHFRYVMD